MILVEADSGEEWDSRTDWRALAERAVRSAVRASSHAALADAPIDVELSVKFTGDEEVRALNAAWRDKDRPTNVLSFPMFEAGPPADIGRSVGGEVLLGDIVLAEGVCAREAAEKNIPVEQHAIHLVVHGTLHLLGYDHETAREDAERMEAVERDALAMLGIADPYSATEVQSQLDA